VDDDDAIGVKLLADLRVLFGREQLAIFTRDAVTELNALEESSWGGWHDGRGIRARDLAKRLKPYGVRSRKVKIDGESLQGYHRDQLEDAWIRYLPPMVPEPVEPVEPAPVYRGSEVPDENEVPEPAKQTEPEIAHSNGKVPEVPEVPHPWTGNGTDPDVDRAERLAPRHADLFGGAA
jgi:hypothetical protein